MARLETKRTILRRFQLSDLDNMIELESNAAIVRFTPYKLPQTKEQTQKRLITLVEKENLQAPLGVWAVDLKDNGEFVGWFMLVNTQFEFPELGFMIPERAWGKGLATEVGSLLIDSAKNNLNYLGVVARTNPENMASIRVLEKLGFKFLKTLSDRDQIVNVYELRF